MKSYYCSVSSEVIWASFDYVKVEAESYLEARKKAIKELREKFDKVNQVLNSADVTLGYCVEFDPDHLYMEEL